ncbi:hypothetical protein GCM10007874_07910 [Labrys miyagiensis]|uniref:Uncharacterized protein n=1 Tax=Labrys miyagiensis TaxID=346912 RepID=A0ABQ6CBZ1_9HYPH|nr:hypothetical protein GCM10007874_07910 [Labrys miyagiensis]
MLSKVLDDVDGGAITASQLSQAYISELKKDQALTAAVGLTALAVITGVAAGPEVYAYCTLNPLSCAQVAEAAGCAVNMDCSSLVGSLPAAEEAEAALGRVAQAWAESGGTATATTNGFISATKISINGTTIALDVTEQAILQQIMRNGDASGALTEQLFNLIAASDRGATLLAGGAYGPGLINGFDHVLEMADGTIIIVDSKQLANGALQLGSSQSGVQLSDAWVRGVLANLEPDSPAAMAVQRALNTGTLITAVTGVNRVTGNLVFVPVHVP